MIIEGPPEVRWTLGLREPLVVHFASHNWAFSGLVFSDLCAGEGLRCFPVTDLGWPADSVIAGESCGGFSVAGNFSGHLNLAGIFPSHFFRPLNEPISLWVVLSSPASLR